MGLQATPLQRAAGFENAKPACQILILHEQYTSYTAAVGVCGRVMERVENAVDFGIKAWSFVELADPNCARLVARTAASADIVFFSMQSRAAPAELKRWLARYFTVRLKSNGLIALLHGSPVMNRQAGEDLVQWLKQVAASLSMDFMALVPGLDETDPAPLLSPGEIHPAAESAANGREVLRLVNHH